MELLNVSYQHSGVFYQTLVLAVVSLCLSKLSPFSLKPWTSEKLVIVIVIIPFFNRILFPIIHAQLHALVIKQDDFLFLAQRLKMWKQWGFCFCQFGFESIF